jgi:membrane AbrB-like protein
MNILHFLLTILAGTACGMGASKLKIPGGLLIGGIIGAAMLNILFANAYMPKDTKLYIQIIAGAFIGCIMEKSDLKRMPYIIKPAGIMLISFLILNLTVGFLIWKVSPLDLITSLMAVIPGSISDTPIIAATMGADAPKVAVMQIVRQILGISIFPSLIFLYDKQIRKKILKMK